MRSLKRLLILGKRGSSLRRGYSDCIICTKEDPKRSKLKILHITEGLSFHPNEQTVKMYINIITKNEGNTPATFRVLHRCKTSACLQKFIFAEPEDQRPELLSKLYMNQIKKNPDNPDSVIFHKRINCFGTDPKGIEVSRSGLGRCFEQLGNNILLTPEIEDPRAIVPFTSYLIPPGDAGIRPNETAICTLKLEITGSTYMKLVGDGSNISVDSYARLKRDIKTYDLPGEGNDAYQTLYEEKVKPENMIIEPREYDIVIFQKIGQSVELRSGSISTTPTKPLDKDFLEKVLSFYGEGSEFCLRFAYPTEVVTEQRRIMGEVVVPAE